MCGIAGIVGEQSDNSPKVAAMLRSLAHRGPDHTATFQDEGYCCLGHNRLAIIDLSAEGNQPMTDPSGRYTITYNGEVYNYVELRNELGEKSFRTRSDTEVLLRAFQEWGEGCLEKLTGMFAFAIWDNYEKSLFAGRDRFGVKPFYYVLNNQTLYMASEIKAFWSVGINRAMNEAVWASYLVHGTMGQPNETFWKGVFQLTPGHWLRYSIKDGVKTGRWYDFVENVEKTPLLTYSDAQAYFTHLLSQGVNLRFRADVPIGFNLSGGVDSSLLLAVVDQMNEGARGIRAFTFTCDDPRYDELPWVKLMLDKTAHALVNCETTAVDIPGLAEKVIRFQDEPGGGVPTLAYSKIFESARSQGIIVLLDGQGMDESWAGYDYYYNDTGSIVQGTATLNGSYYLDHDFCSLAIPRDYPTPFQDNIQNLQYRDLFFTKLPRALRYNDRISMMHSTELREPFLDHRLVEFAFAQPPDRKHQNGATKRMLREIATGYLGAELATAPKRVMQTPQREWLRTTLANWCDDMINNFSRLPFVDRKSVTKAWKEYRLGKGDSSFHIWQWIDCSMLLRTNGGSA